MKSSYNYQMCIFLYSIVSALILGPFRNTHRGDIIVFIYPQKCLALQIIRNALERN